METVVAGQPYTGEVRSVVLDWAGTTVDFGCIGPTAVFLEVFGNCGVRVATEGVRRFMGLAKRDHIRSLCGLPDVAAQWVKIHGRKPTEADVGALYAQTEKVLVSSAARYSEPIDGLHDTVAALRRKRIKIGTTTGYMRAMMDALVPAAEEKGYRPDAVVCSSDVPAGRPYPWMCYLNAIALQTYPMEAMVKIGDTISDIEEGLNAGMWTIGLTRTGNELGLPFEQVEELGKGELAHRLGVIEARFRDGGAHYAVEGIGDVPPLIEAINERLARGERP